MTADAGREPNLVRPYMITDGRTDPTVALPMEAAVQALPQVAPPEWQPGDVKREIVELAQTNPSVAEVAARLGLPLGVARVLIADLVVAGYVKVAATLGDMMAPSARRELIERTLHGLQAL